MIKLPKKQQLEVYSMHNAQRYTYRWIAPGEDLSDAFYIRTKVFIEEQQVPEDIEIDEIDPRTDHLVIYVGGMPAATGRIVWETPVLLGRIAVLREHRGSGLGAEIVNRLTEKVFEHQKENEVHIHAQTHALPFYEKLGFQAYGAIFDEAGIPHQAMVKRKPSSFPS